MFTQQQPLFIYTISPLHMGAGSATGLVDNPIQREIHTGWPSMAGSGIKGAIRHALRPEWTDELNAIFGPETALHAGAISFMDAQIVCFPVRSLKGAYVYATCPMALSRIHRFIKSDWQVPPVKEQEALIANEELKQGDDLILEALAFRAKRDDVVFKIATSLADQAIPSGFFSEKFKKDLVILSDTDFTHFVKNSTLVEPHVRIDDETGAADSEGGGLFYTENLPPESLLITLAMASKTHDSKSSMTASEVLKKVSEAINKDQTWQFGGDATTGRGLVMLRFSQNGGK